MFPEAYEICLLDVHTTVNLLQGTHSIIYHSWPPISAFFLVMLVDITRNTKKVTWMKMSEKLFQSANIEKSAFMCKFEFMKIYENCNSRCCSIFFITKFLEMLIFWGGIRLNDLKCGCWYKYNGVLRTQRSFNTLWVLFSCMRKTETETNSINSLC